MAAWGYEFYLFFQPRRQGFSLKKWVGRPFFKGKALGTRLEKNKPPSGEGGWA